MKNTVLNRLEPLILLVRARAIINAMTFISMVDTTVNADVNPNACQKLSSAMAYA